MAERVQQFLAERPAVVLSVVLIILVLITGVGIQPNYLRQWAHHRHISAPAGSASRSNDFAWPSRWHDLSDHDDRDCSPMSRWSNARSAAPAVTARLAASWVQLRNGGKAFSYLVTGDAVSLSASCWARLHDVDGDPGRLDSGHRLCQAAWCRLLR
ncbi:MAG: hypothetical protein R2932_21145 [Caldilineaceae bacterium]